jgi:hypothetical protein
VAFAPAVKMNYMTGSKRAKGTGVILIVIVGLLNFHPLFFCLNLLNILDGLDDGRHLRTYVVDEKPYIFLLTFRII